MDDRSCLSEYVDCYCVDKIKLGKDVVVSQYSFLCTASHDYKDSSFPLVTAPISIEKNAWIAADVFLGPGVTVGEGAVVGARSTVFNNVDRNTVIAGSPPRLIGERGSDKSQDE